MFQVHPYYRGGEKQPPSESELRLANLASTLSWIANITLIIVKVIALAVSNSKSVAAAVVDSAVDIISQLLLSVAEWHTRKHNPNYPIGRARLESLSVIGCAALMVFASVEVG